MQPEEVVIADLIRERDEAREQVRSLTVERDAERERGDRHNVTIGRVGADLAVVLGRLSRAREALGDRPEWVAGWQAEEGSAYVEVHPSNVRALAETLAALRAALAEPLGDRKEPL